MVILSGNILDKTNKNQEYFIFGFWLGSLESYLLRDSFILVLPGLGADGEVALVPPLYVVAVHDLAVCTGGDLILNGIQLVVLKGEIKFWFHLGKT